MQVLEVFYLPQKTCRIANSPAGNSEQIAVIFLLWFERHGLTKGSNFVPVFSFLLISQASLKIRLRQVWIQRYYRLKITNKVRSERVRIT